jgi:hypothetical protein
MNKQEWQDKKKYCMDNAVTIDKQDKRLEDENGVQYVPFTTTFNPPIPSDYIFVRENEIVGGVNDWRINSSSEYLVNNGAKIYEADCSEVV